MSEEQKKYSEKKTKYNIEYAKRSLKRIPLDVQKEEYEEIKAAAESVHMPVNAFIKAAIREKIESLGAAASPDPEL